MDYKGRIPLCQCLNHYPQNSESQVDQAQHLLLYLNFDRVHSELQIKR